MNLRLACLSLALAHALVESIIKDAEGIAELADALYPHGSHTETKGAMRRQKNLDRLAEIGERFGYETHQFRFDGWTPRFGDKNSNVHLLDLGPIALTIASTTARRPTGRKPEYRSRLIQPISVQSPLFTQIGPPPAPYRWSRLLIVAYEIDRSDPALGRVGRIRLRAAACDGTDDYIDLGDLRAYAALYDAAPTVEAPETPFPLEAKQPLNSESPIQPGTQGGDHATKEPTGDAGASGEPNS